MAGDPLALAQAGYQVRFDWGPDGFARLASSDVVVVVDVLSHSTATIATVAAGQTVTFDASEPHRSAAGRIAAAAVAENADAIVLVGALSNASAVAQAILDIQVERGDRVSVAVLAAGEPTAGADAGASESWRYAVEDHLGAGAIIDGLAARGIDHSAPDAAVAGESFRALRRAVVHLLSSSGTGRELAAQNRQDDVRAGSALDSTTVVPVLRDGEFRAL